jgi:hypothetical protein
MMSEVDEYLAKLKIICTEPDNLKREAVADEMVKAINSDSFVNILISIFESQNDIYDAGI